MDVIQRVLNICCCLLPWERTFSLCEFLRAAGCSYCLLAYRTHCRRRQTLELSFLFFYCPDLIPKVLSQRLICYAKGRLFVLPSYIIRTLFRPQKRR